MELILVNKYSPLPEDYKPEDLIYLKDTPNRCFDLNNEEDMLNKTAAEALNSFLMEMTTVGYTGIIINSAYRDKKRQQEIYDSGDKGYVVKPGESEHETGLAVDIGVDDNENNRELTRKLELLPHKWMADNCHNFGFILRYPEFKEDMTGVIYEPWHFRYVGLRVAKYMKNHDLCLEEYFEEKFGVPIVKTDINKETREAEISIWNFLMEKLQNPYGTAALMGNLYAESGLKFNVLEYYYHKILGMNSNAYTAAVDSGEYEDFSQDVAGYGLAQWTLGARKKALIEKARSSGKSISDKDLQLNYLWEELNTDYTEVRDALLNATSIRSASDVVLTKFERPANMSDAVKKKRESYGRIYFYRYINKEQLDDQLNIYSLWREDISLLLKDYNTGEILYERNADKVRPIGSITKIMTHYVLAKKIFTGKNRLNELVKIDKETSDMSMDPRFSGGEYLAAGESYPVEILMKLSLVVSACASTTALVRHFYGSEENMVMEMNKEAKALNLSGHFEDVIGTNPNSIASAKDLAIISENMIRNYPKILEITSESSVHFNNQEYSCTSRILRDGEINGLDGLKTGTTPSAGKCYLATAARRNHRVISVVLNAQENEERYNETIALLEYGLSK